MNRSYKVIWNQSLNCFMAVAEYAKSRGKSSSHVVSSNSTASAAVSSGARLLRLSSLTVALAATGMTLSSQVFAVVGTNSIDTRDCTTAVANKSTGDTAIGCGSNSSGNNAIAIGGNSTTQVDSGATQGGQSIAIGFDAQTKGDQSVGLGANVRASGNSSIAIGGDDVDKVAVNSGALYNQITGGNITQGTYIGTQSSGGGSTAIGVQAVSSGAFSTALGMTSSASGAASVALGVKSTAAGQGALAIGAVSNASNTGSVALGINSKSSGVNSVAIGSGNSTTTGANATGTNATAIGSGSSAAINGTAIGSGAKANLAGGVAIGTGSIANIAAGVSGFDPSTGNATTKTSNVWQSTQAAVALGDSATGVTRQLTGLAAGSNDSDAVNVAQLKTVTDQTFKIQANGDAASAVKSSDTVQFVNGNNVAITRNGNNVTIGTSLTPTFTSVTSTGAMTAGSLNTGGTLTVTGASNLNGGANLNNNKITGLAKGTNATDAVNFSQLAESELTSSVVAGNNTSVSSATTGNNTAYTVNAKKSTVSAGSTAVAVTPGTEANDTTNYAVDLSTATKASLVKADTAVQTVSSNDSNLTAVKTGNNVAFDFADAPVFTGQVKATGFDASNAKIVNVANGTAATDAATFGQLTNIQTAGNNKINQLGTSTAANLGGGAVYNTTTGAVSAPAYSLNNGTVTADTVGGALTNIDGRTTTNTTNIARGFNIGADNGADDNVQLGETVNFTNTDGNLVATVSNNGINYDLAENIDLGATGSVLTGNTRVNNAGITVTGGTNDTVLLSRNGLNNGNNVITNVANGVAATDAATFGQLSTTNTNVATNTSNIANVQAQTNRGFNISADNSDLVNNETVDNVQLGETVDFTNTDGNLVATVSNNGINYDLADDISVDSITADDGNGNVTTLNATGTNVTDGTNRSDYTANGFSTTDGTTTTTFNQAGLSFTDVNGATGPSITAAGIDAGDTVISNLRPGSIAAGSKDAVTGDQLNTTNTNVTNNTTAIGDINAGRSGIVRQDAGTGAITVGAATGGTSVNFANSTGGARTLSGVADGNIAANSKEAINGGQVNTLVTQVTNQFTATNTNVTDNTNRSTGNLAALGGGAAYNATNNTYTQPIYTLDDGSNTGTNVTANNVGDALDNLDGRTTTNTSNIANVQAQANQGFNISADNGTADNVQLGETVNFTNTDGNLVATVSNNGINYDLAENIDLGVNGSVRTGNTVTNNAGVRIDDGTGNITAVTATGTNVTDGTNTANYGANGFVIRNQQTNTMSLLQEGNFATFRVDENTGIPTSGSVITPDFVYVGDGNGVGSVVNKDGFGFSDQISGTAPNMLSTTPSIRRTGIDAGNTRITNVADGTELTDAATFGQVQNAANAVTNNAPVVYTQADGTQVYNTANGFNTAQDGTGTAVDNADIITSVRNANGSTTTATRLSNVANGTVDAGSKDAINGDQLNTTNMNVTNNTTAIGDINAGRSGIVRQDSGTGAITVGAATGGTSVNFANSTGGARTLSGVADGNIAANSKDAVNGGQVNTLVTQVTNQFTATNANVTDNTNRSTGNLAALGGGAAYNATNNTYTQPIYTLDDGSNTGTNVTANNVGDALDNLDGRTTSNTAAINQGFNISADNGTADNVQLGETVNFTNTDGNLVATVSDNGINYDLAENIDLGVNGSVRTGNTVTNNAGVRIDDGTGNITAVTATGTNVTDGNGNTGRYNAGSTILTDDSGNINASAAIGNAILDDQGNANLSGAIGNALFDQAGNVNLSGAQGNVVFDNADNRTTTSATGTNVTDGTNTSNYDANGLTATDVNGNSTLVNQTGLSFTNDLGDATGPSITATGINAGGSAISNVADGVATTDVATIGQLQASNNAADVKTDALGNSTATNLGGGASYTAATGIVSAPTYTLDNGTNTGTTADFDNVGGALDNLDGRTTTNTSNIANVQAQANRGFNISADNGTADNVQLGETVNFTNTDGNLVATVSDNGINYDLAENIDLGVNGSVRTGNTVTNNAGVRIDDGTGNITAVTATGTNVTDGNGNTGRYNAGSTILTDDSGNINASAAIGNAILDDQGNANLSGAIGNALFDQAGNVNLSGAQGNVVFDNADNRTTTSATGTNVTDGTNTSNYDANGLTATDVNGNSTLVNQTGLSFTNDLGDATGPSITATGINAGGSAISNVADGVATTDVATIGQLQASNNAADVKTDALGNSTATNLGGGASYTAATGIVSAPTYTLDNGTNTGTTADFDNVGGALDNLDGRTTTNTSNIANVQAQANRGFNISADNGTADNVQLGETVNFTNTDGNLVATVSNNGINYDLAENIDLGVNGSVRTGNTVTNNAGITILNGPVDTVTLGRNGLNNGGNRVTNVANGLAADDAATFGQVTDVNNKVNTLGDSTAANLGGGATYTAATGTVSAPTYTLDNGANTGTTADFDNVGDALGNLDGRTTTNTSNIANVQAQANQGFNISAAGGTADNVQLGETVDFTNTDGNLVVSSNGANGINYNLAENIDLGANGTLKTGNTTTNNAGVRIDDGTNITAVTAAGTKVTDGTNTSNYGANGLTIVGGPSMTTAGINAGNRTITNLADGVAATDAATKGQVDAVATGLTDLTAGAVKYDRNADNTINKNSVTFEGTPAVIDQDENGNDVVVSGGTRLSNVANGINAADAVNKGQLDSLIAQNVTKVEVNDQNGNPVTVNITDQVVNRNIDNSNMDSLFLTYNVEGQGITDRLTIGETVQKMNTEGVKFAHTKAVSAKGDLGVTNDSSAGGDNSTAIGVNAIIQEGADSTVALGHNTEASANATNSVVIGKDSQVTGQSSIAIGNGAQALGNQSISIGTGNIVNGNNSGAFGDPSIINGDNSYSVGNNNTINSNDTFVLGNNVTSTVGGSVVLGTGSAARTGAGVAGYGATGNAAITATTSTTGAVAVGDATNGIYRQVTGVAAGTADSDAVNVSQLKAVSDTLQSNNEALSNAAVQYDKNADGTVNKGSITLGGGAAGTTITNVAAGNVSAGSTDAVNGSQLHNLGNGVAGIIGGDAALDAAGNLTASNIGGTGKGNINDAIAAVNQGNAQANENIQANTDRLDAGLSFGADSGTTINKPIGDTTALNFEGGNNITTTATSSGIKFDLNGNIDVDNITADTVTTGNTTVSNSGVTIKDGPSMTTAGINAGNKTITGVADGIEVNDAVNLGQLSALDNKLSNSVNELGYKINEVEDDANAGVSAAMAMSSLPQAYIPGKSMVGGGIATYNGQSAVAIGVSKVSDNGRWVIKVNGTADTQGNAGGAVGAGFHF